MMLPLRCRAVLALACAIVPGALGAQRVSGTIQLPGGAAGGGGILLVAMDSTGAEVVRAVTSDDGRYALPLPRAGKWRIEAQRVGFTRTVIVDKEIAGGEAIILDVPVGTGVTDLPPRGATPPASCGGGLDAQRYVAILLNEMNKALTASQLAAGRQGVSARWAVTNHRLASNGRDTSRYSIARRAGNPMSAFGTPVQQELQRSGYVVLAGTDRLFRGLDLASLLSPWFTDAYCFTAREGDATAFILSFAPRRPRREIVDISGEIKFARASLELQSIDYLYQGLAPDEDKHQGGGHISFARAIGGSWLVADWFIRFPQVGYMEIQGIRGQDRARTMQADVMGHEILAWRTTALVEGTRRIYIRDAIDAAGAQGALRTSCIERVITTPVGAVRGRITLDGRPVSAARVVATWRIALDIGGEIPLWRDEIRETSTSSRGEWALCDLQAGQTVELAWEVMGRRTTSLVKIERDQIITVGDDGKPVTAP